MLNNVPPEIDREVADRKLANWGIGIDVLSQEQHKYIYGE
jgi:S-adenosylhomocysteine hydrolase